MKPDAAPIRLLDIHRDLDEVANLIETCFRSHLDADGYQYIHELRRAARQFNFIQFIPGAGERVTLPIYGYVYEQEGRVIGNLSLIPFMYRKKWIYLIANVAVHPDYQNKGIGKQLTNRALQHIQEHGISAAWLQVRDDNEKAIHLYESLGFTEQARRTNWLSQDHADIHPSLPPGFSISQRMMNGETWEQQQKWLAELYPNDIAWYLSFNLNSFKPTFWREVLNLLTGTPKEHWRVYQQHEIIGAATWESTHRSADILWLATGKPNEDIAIRSLLPYLASQVKPHRKLLVNYPAERARKAFTEAGFTPHNTLIWMKVDFET